MPEVKPGFKDFPNFFPQHGIFLMQVDIPEKTMFFHSMDAWLCKLEIKDFPNFFPQHGIFLMQVGNE